MVAIRAVVRGRVQQVGFRAFVRGCAVAHGVTGWVRNTPEGAVEIEAEGAEPAVEALLADCRRGPPSSRVTEVVVEFEELAAPRYQGFELRR